MKYLFFILYFLMSCGTEVGNPIQDGNLQAGEPTGATTVFPILQSICDKVSECYSVDLEVCATSSLLVDGFDSVLNLGTTNYTNLQEIVDDELLGVISANSTFETQCQSDIENLLCSDSEVIAAYNPAAPNDYSSMFRIIPIGGGSCQDVY